MDLLIPDGLHLVLAGLTVNSWLGAEKAGDTYRNTDFSNFLISHDINWWYRLKDSAADLEFITYTYWKITQSKHKGSEQIRAF